MRKAFSMITAIFVMIIMATVAMLVFSMSGKMIKGTTIQYRTEQAALLARSYTELAVMAVINHDRHPAGAIASCVEHINGVVNSITPGQAPAAGTNSTNGGGYDVNTTIYYLGNNLPCTPNMKLNDSTNAARSSTTITSNPYHSTASPTDDIAAILVDVQVRYKDPNADDPSKTPWITYHRRTLQKI